MIKRKLIEELPFEVDARVAIQLGRESISSSLIAIIELVKNAYDADAENVVISFHNIGTPDAFMIIEDDGLGMTEADIKKYWMRIGTDYKHKVGRSKNKDRILTGAKGLGRLGIDRLCKKLLLQTKTEKNNYINELEINWTDYEVPETSLSQVKHALYKNNIPTDSLYLKSNAKGTRLKLIGVKDNWTIDSIKELRNELALLISPFSGVNDFTIKLDTEYEEEGLNGPVSSVHYLEAAEWIVNSKIDKDGFVSASMHSNMYKVKYELKPTIWKEWIKTQSDAPRCGPLKFQFYYIPMRTTEEFKKINFERKYISEFLKSNRGIRIYRDNFRIKPYGNPDGSGDWLNLGYRRSSNPAAVSRTGWPVGPQQVVGGVFISRDENKGLIDQTNREGIVEEPPFYDLRTYAAKIIEWFEHNIVTFTQSNQKTQEKVSDKIIKTTKEARKKINDIITNIEKIKKAKSLQDQEDAINSIMAEAIKIKNDLNESDKHVEELDAQNEEEKNTLANLASLGILTICFGHEAKGSVTKAYLNAQELGESFEAGKFMIAPDLEEDIRTKIEIIKDSTHYVNAFASFALENVKRDKRTRGNISISEIARKVLKSFSLSFGKQGVEILDSEINNNIIEIKGFKIDWESIFVNLITNSIWAFRNYTPSGKRQIKISIKEEDDLIIIHFSDNGKGLEKGTETLIFRPGFSTRRNEKGIVEGTGMGLAIVESLICDHAKGSIEVKSPGELDGAEFIIKIPIN